MSSWLSKLFAGLAYSMIGKLIKSIWEYLKNIFILSKREKDLAKKVRTVEEISAEIKKLLEENKQIPEGLKDELRLAARKLVNDSVNNSGN